MNDKCKYCDYVSECSRKCEYDSILCKVQRSFPKVVDKSYEQLQQENTQLKNKINMAIEYYEANQQECVIGRNKDEKLIKEYYLPAQCSKKMLDILKEN